MPYLSKGPDEHPYIRCDMCLRKKIVPFSWGNSMSLSYKVFLVSECDIAYT